MKYLRLYRTTAIAVEKGLAAALLFGINAGARTMRDAGVPITVALRVLLHPELRRASDWTRETSPRTESSTPSMAS